jgi:diguanylate cyclase (GGDEF)-like protein
LLVAMMLVVIAGTVTGMRVVETTVRARAIEQEVLTASIVITLSVDRNVTDEVYASSSVGETPRADLDADVRALQERGELVGLEVWDHNGSLLYADANHPLGEATLPSEELRRALSGSPFVIVKNDRGHRGVPLLEVFQPADPDRDGVIDGVTEVLLPHSKVDSVVSASTPLVRLGAAFVVGMVAWALMATRRRLQVRQHQAEHDPLTGLGNRALLARRGATVVRPEGTHGAATRHGSALLLIDLDGFKRVNDALGHSVGDDVLVAIADRLRSVVQAEDQLVRLGGDEFAVLLAPLETDDAGDRLAKRILEALHDPVDVGPVSVQIGASIGIALHDAGVGLGEMLRRADVAMYQAKRQAGDFHRYTPDTDDNDADHLVLLGDFRKAIDRDELILNYQPKVDRERRLSGVEALVRWMHPTRGLLAPDAFLPLVEETALMKPLTEWILRQATAQAAQWQAGGLDVPVAINVSPRILVDEGFVPLVQAVLADTRLPRWSLTIEITETAIVEDPDGACRAIEDLRACGVGVSIDDFGTGFTSLSHLKRLPISEIKIDREFVQGLLDRGVDHSIVAYTIRLAHDLSVPVVAEGVETEASLDELRALGCDQFQGYLFAHPLDVEAFDEWTQLQTVSPRAVLR